MIYKVSFVIIGRPDPGEIVNMDTQPRVGDQVELGTEMFEITQVIELIPPRGEFAYLHATCKSISEAA
ncbi:MAG: hypothetical protein GY832_33725 [Chloroflexi bacterium]|nr:hypothetical protein [Chloroflexota bacterium]